MHFGVSIVTAVMLLAGSATAGGFGIPEVGVRRTAMATIVGRPDDASAIYHNPAGLILQPGFAISAAFGFALLDVSLDVKPWPGSNELLGMTPDADGYYPTIEPKRAFAVVPLLAVTRELIRDRLVVGGAAYVGNASGAAFEADGVTRYHMTDGYVVAPQVVASAAYRIAPSLTLGATAGVVNVRVHQRREIWPDSSFIQSAIGSRAELVLDASGWAPTWTIGAFGQPHPRVTWGATIQGRISADLEGPVTETNSADAANPNDMMIGVANLTQLFPWAAFVGLSVDITPNIELSGEGRYWLYRQYDKQRIELRGLLIRELEVQKNYHDSFAVSAGIRVHDLARAPGLELMAGGQFDRSPAPPETVSIDQPTFSHPAVHTGARYRIGRYRLGASYLHYWYLVPVIDNSTTSPPSNVRGRGTNNIFTISIEATL
ncbi:MAG: OmpP1/FadL family transporter [Kofleriaceae bacterium]